MSNRAQKRVDTKSRKRAAKLARYKASGGKSDYAKKQHLPLPDPRPPVWCGGCFRRMCGCRSARQDALAFDPGPALR